MYEKSKDKIFFNKIIDELDEWGNIKKQVTIQLYRWSSDEFKNYKPGAPIKKGVVCSFKVLTIDGNSTKEAFIRFNPYNKDIKKALSEMYETIEGSK